VVLALPTKGATSKALGGDGLRVVYRDEVAFGSAPHKVISSDRGMKRMGRDLETRGPNGRYGVPPLTAFIIGPLLIWNLTENI
jgi:hypothetical protein